MCKECKEHQVLKWCIRNGNPVNPMSILQAPLMLQNLGMIYDWLFGSLAAASH